jgi:NAD(P)-dependent dehydrogenase (short-subunit alcohol dehydrogenase family)
MFPDLGGKVALVTGGTRGLGLAAGLALGRHQASVWLTHKWGSADEDEVRGRFADVGAPPPRIVMADVADPSDTHALFDEIAAEHDGLDLLVANACVAAVGGSLAALRPRDLARCLQASAWSLPDHVDHCRRALGAGPKRIVVISSDGVTTHHPRYDYVALAKAALEAMAARSDVARDARVFVVRTRQSTTGGFAEVFGERTLALLQRYARFAVQPAEIGDVVLACASGHLDALHGQPLQVDHGAAWLDNVLTAEGLA